MFKRFLAIIVVIACLCTTLVGCSNDGKLDGKQDYSYVVTSNGGSAVAYGNYIYFINGTRGYEDSDGKSNVYGEVIKGGLYRAELSGQSKQEGNYKTFTPSRNDKNLIVNTTATKDYVGDTIEVVNTNSIAQKTAGTSGYKNGGLFIIGDSLYFATPNNQKGKSGSVQFNKTDFFRVSLDDCSYKKIYTTNADTNTSPYGFFHYNNHVYLTVLDGTDLISVKMKKSNGKVVDTIKIAENVTSAVIPVKPAYYEGITENTIYDFIYFERKATKEDSVVNSGDVLEMIRPDGTSRAIFEADGKSDYKLECVKDGMLFYRKYDNYVQKLYAKNMFAPLYQVDSAFKNDFEKLYKTDSVNDYDVEEIVLSISDLSSLDVHPFVPSYDFLQYVDTANSIVNPNPNPNPNANSDSINVYHPVANDVWVITSTQDTSNSEEKNITMNLYRNDAYLKQLATGATFFDAYSDGNIYYTEAGTLKKVNIVDESLEPSEVATGVVLNTLGADIAGGMLIYSGTIGEVTGYACMKEVNGLDGADEQLTINKFEEDEQPNPIEKIIIVEQPTKKEYNIGDSEIDLDGLVVEAQKFAKKDGSRDENEEITVTSDMITGFDTSASGSVTITVTYATRTATFDITVKENSDEESEDSCSSLVPSSPWIYAGGGALAIVLVLSTLFVKKRQNVDAEKDDIA